MKQIYTTHITGAGYLGSPMNTWKTIYGYIVNKELRDENGLLHNEGGPARFCFDGSVEYYIHGRLIH
jgi:hypothetical protein